MPSESEQKTFVEFETSLLSHTCIKLQAFPSLRLLFSACSKIIMCVSFGVEKKQSRKQRAKHTQTERLTVP